MKNKINVTKKVASTFAVYGAGVITYAVIRNNLPTDLAIHKKAATFVAAFVISGVVADAVEAQTDKLVDTFIGIYRGLKTKS